MCMRLFASGQVPRIFGNLSLSSSPGDGLQVQSVQRAQTAWTSRSIGSSLLVGSPGRCADQTPLAAASRSRPCPSMPLPPPVSWPQKFGFQSNLTLLAKPWQCHTWAAPPLFAGSKCAFVYVTRIKALRLTDWPASSLSLHAASLHAGATAAASRVALSRGNCCRGLLSML